MSIYPVSEPDLSDIDAMTSFGGNYWRMTDITDDSQENVIGLFKSNNNGVDETYFWHYFVLSNIYTCTGSTDEINIQYQMGDRNSDWQGVYLKGPVIMYKDISTTQTLSDD